MKEAVFKGSSRKTCFVFNLVNQYASGGIFPSVSFITMFKQRENRSYSDISAVGWLTGSNCRDLAKNTLRPGSNVKLYMKQTKLQFELIQMDKA